MGKVISMEDFRAAAATAADDYAHESPSARASWERAAARDLVNEAREEDSPEQHRLRVLAENHVTGASYEETKELDLRDIAKLIRKDIKAAIKAGTIPKVKTSVRISRFSGGQSLNVEVKTVPEGFKILSRERLDFERANPFETGGYRILEDAADDILEILKGIVNAYNFDKSDTQTDYFHNRFYDHVQFDSDLTRAERASYKAEVEAAELADRIAGDDEAAAEVIAAELAEEAAAETAPEDTNSQDDWLTYLGAAS